MSREQREQARAKKVSREQSEQARAKKVSAGRRVEQEKAARKKAATPKPQRAAPADTPSTSTRITNNYYNGGQSGYEYDRGYNRGYNRGYDRGYDRAL